MNKTLAIVTGSLLATNIAGVILSSNISYNNGLKVGNTEGQTVLADQRGVTRDLRDGGQSRRRGRPVYFAERKSWSEKILWPHQVASSAGAHGTSSAALGPSL